jgi:hypothetical protein
MSLKKKKIIITPFLDLICLFKEESSQTFTYNFTLDPWVTSIRSSPIQTKKKVKWEYCYI